VSLTAKDVEEIIRVLNESQFDELELEIDGIKMSLRRSGAVAPVAPVAPVVREKRSVVAAVPVSSEVSHRPVAATARPPGTQVVSAPLLGTFYRAPKPGDPPYVNVGDRVTADSIVGIIEVMKLMNVVRAGIAGTVIEVVAENGALVEFEQDLLYLRSE
jgi:acetyl-CoA carboxylase biotin carboxyl carrier protein